MIRVFVISLKNSKRRRVSIQSSLDTLKIPFEFIDAVDGRQLSPDQRSCVKNHFLSAGEIGVALSHSFVYEKMVREHIERAIVLEDDAIIDDNFKKIIQSDYLTKENFVMFYHLHAFTGWFESGEGLFGKYKLVKPIFSPLGAVAYCLTNVSAQKLYNVTKNIHTVADFPLDLKELGVKCVTPRIVQHPSLDNSNIADGRESVIGKFFRIFTPRHSRLYSLLANIYNIRKHTRASVRNVLGNLFFKRISPKVEGE